jgi:hypothetical protein
MFAVKAAVFRSYEERFTAFNGSLTLPAAPTAMQQQAVLFIINTVLPAAGGEPGKQPRWRCSGSAAGSADHSTHG